MAIMDEDFIDGRLTRRALSAPGPSVMPGSGEPVKVVITWGKEFTWEFISEFHSADWRWVPERGYEEFVLTLRKPSSRRAPGGR